MIHILLHFLVPMGATSLIHWKDLFSRTWFRDWMILSATILVDLDHLLADPIYDPQRCSIGFHPLHTTWPIIAYLVMMGFPKTRLIGLGLTIHMFLDAVDCFMM